MVPSMATALTSALWPSPTNPSLATFGQEGNSRYTQPLLLRELHVLHQVLLLSNQEEEEQEDEEKKKRGDATL